MRVFPMPKQTGFLPLFFLSLGLGPVVIALLAKIAVDYFPYHPRYVYIALIIVFFLMVFFCGVTRIKQLAGVYRALYASVKQSGFFRDKLKFAILAIVIIVYGLIYIQATALPIIGADPLKFAYYAKSTIEERIDTPEKTISGKLDISRSLRGVKAKHYPIAGLYLWFFLTNDAVRADLLCRTATPLYYLFLMILIGFILWPRGEWTALWGIVLFAFIPYFISQTIGNAQDAGNLFLLLLSFVWLAHAIGKKKLSYFVTLAVILGITVLSARINFLVVFFFFTSIAVLIILRLKQRKLVIWLSICTLLTVFLAVDIVNLVTDGNSSAVKEITSFQEAKNYRANRAILNDINKNDGHGFTRLLIRKIKPFKNLFAAIHFNFYALLGIPAILFWVIYARDKNPIEVILLTSILSYLFLVAFHDSKLFLFSSVYREKINSNQFFLLYIRYLLPLFVMLAIFNAIFIAKMTLKLGGRLSRPVAVIIVLIVLSIPVGGRLLNNKQSLGIDDWKKMFVASESEKLFSYRRGYGKIIEFIRANVKEKQRILTPTRYKFIPYYSNRRCIGSRALGKKVLSKPTKKLFQELKARGIAYILPTDKFRLISYLKPPIENLINNPSFAYIVYDSQHWRMYKLRKKIKRYHEETVSIPNGKFSALDGNKPRDWNCTIPQEKDWGIVSPTESSGIIFLTNRRSKKRRLYTGSGEYKLPPSHFNDQRYPINASTYYKLWWKAKASRPILLMVRFLEYDHAGKIKQKSTRVLLSTQFKEKFVTIYTEPNTREYRILFQIFDAAQLYLKDITLSELKPVN
jgi:hypothetical protein